MPDQTFERYGSFVRPFLDVGSVSDNVLKLFEGETQFVEVGRGGNGVVRAPHNFYGTQFVKKTPLKDLEFNMTERFREILTSPDLKPYVVWSLDVHPIRDDSREYAIMERLQPLGDAIAACSETQLETMSQSFLRWSLKCLQTLNSMHLYAPDFTLGNIAHGLTLEPAINHEFRLIDVDGIVDGELLGETVQVSSAYVQFLSPDGAASVIFSKAHFGGKVEHLRRVLRAIQDLASYLVHTVFEIRLHRAGTKTELKKSVALMQSLCLRAIFKEFGVWPGDIIMSFRVPVEVTDFVKPRFTLKGKSNPTSEPVYSTCLKQKLNQNGIYFNDTSEDGLNLKCNEERLEFILMKNG